MSYKWKLVTVIILGTFVVAMDATIVNIALPRILTVFNETLDKVQFVASGYMLATAVSAPLAAFAGARFGMKRVFLFGLIMFLVGSMLCGISWDANSLIVFRIVQGLSGGLLMPMALTLLFSNVPKNEQGSVIGVFGIVQVLAPSIGLTLGGYLVEYLNWRWCFYINVPVVVAAVGIGSAWLQDTPHQTSLPLDIQGFVLAAVGFGTLLYGLSYAPSWGWTDLRTLTLFAIGIISLTTWTVVELRVKIPLLDLRVFRFRGYALGTFLLFIVIVGLYGALLLMPLFLQNVRGLGALQTGVLLIPQAIGTAVGSIIGGRLYDRTGARIPVIFGLLLTGILTWQLYYLNTDTSDTWLMLVTGLRGIGMGFALSPVVAFALAEVPVDMTSQGSTINRVLLSVFSAMGAAILASLLTSFEKSNLGALVQTLTPNSGMTLQALSTAQVALQKAGLSLQSAHQTAVSLLYQMTALRATVSAFNKIFIISAIVTLLGLIPALFISRRAK